MNTAIIAEFNPLHKGHEKLITLAKRNSSGLIIVLSSSFTQRGTPAIISKFARSEMAVKSGADLVVELPFPFSCNAAPEFAKGAVNLLEHTHLADALTFGMEDPDFDIARLIDIMKRPEYHELVRSNLDKGCSFSKANSESLEKLMPGSSDFITKPNNLLAMSYIMNNNNLKVLPVKREGEIKSKMIRENLASNLDMLPEYSQRILQASKRPDSAKLWLILQSILIRSTPEELRKIYCIDEGIENLFIKNCSRSLNLDDFIGRCVCARYTRSHIMRRLVYIMLNIDRYELYGFMKSGVPYCRVLAFNSRGREILRDCRKKSQIRIITSLNQAKSRHERFFAGLEHRATQLYELLFDEPDMRQELHNVLKY